MERVKCSRCKARTFKLYGDGRELMEIKCSKCGHAFWMKRLSREYPAIQS